MVTLIDLVVCTLKVVKGSRISAACAYFTISANYKPAYPYSVRAEIGSIG